MTIKIRISYLKPGYDMINLRHPHIISNVFMSLNCWDSQQQFLRHHSVQNDWGM